MGVQIPRAVEARYQAEAREIPARIERQAEFARKNPKRAQVPQAILDVIRGGARRVAGTGNGGGRMAMIRARRHHRNTLSVKGECGLSWPPCFGLVTILMAIGVVAYELFYREAG